MQLLSENLGNRLFKEIDDCNESIVVVSPFLSTYTIQRLINSVKKKGLNCTVVTRFERKAFIDGASSLEALKILINNNVTVLALKNLHSKVYVFDKKTCMIGSANFTKKALTQNHELLMSLTEGGEVSPILNYTDKLIDDIHVKGNWQITDEQIEAELKIKNAYVESEKVQSVLSYSWGAELNIHDRKRIDLNEVVLSVSVGGTHQLVSKYLIHAHPNDRNYNQLNDLITFRQSEGGRMAAVYYIESTTVIDPFKWKEALEELDYSVSVKDRIHKYIIERSIGFGFEKPISFKFYILTLAEDLHHEPRPKTNNAGPRYYTLGDLLNRNEYI
ncbi:HKD family nuclease [Peribacillus frigoritolerans]|uniref:phospholipase D family protein n=1 Tax=Peribacillus frigoritolerans TaxID=450367 RepID=UPI00209F4F2B|nr:phospholipase D family protein [Peribacillus frigoritolerans]MCP1495099.1 HKD family nuclease [Peribacillus frigoritolerans]